MEKGLNTVLLGPPGSGKGVQAELLKKKFNFKVISVGEILRIEVRKKSNIGKRIEKVIDSGRLIDSKMAVAIVKKHVGKRKNNLLFDGFPREVYEAKMLDKFIKVSHVFVMKVPEELIIKRLSSRYECYCGMTYNLTSKKPRHDLMCDKCGRKLYRREDDKPGLIRKRINIYKRETLPVVLHYKKNSKTKVIGINGAREIRDVFNDVKKVLE